MAADLSIHALTAPCTESDLAEFFRNTLGSRWFGGFTASRPTDYGEGSAWVRVADTPQVWIGEVSWLKAALTDDSETFVPNLVASVHEIIGENLPLIDDSLIERLKAAHDAASNETSYSTAEWEPIGKWLEANKGVPAFTVSW